MHRYGGAPGATITMTAGGAGKARLTGPFGLSLVVSGVIADGAVHITPDAAALAALPAFLRSTITNAMTTPIPLPALALGVHPGLRFVHSSRVDPARRRPRLALPRSLTQSSANLGL